MVRTVVCIASLIFAGAAVADDATRDREIEVVVALAKAKPRVCASPECRATEVKVEASVIAAKVKAVAQPLPKSVAPWYDANGKGPYYTHPDGTNRTYPPAVSSLLPRSDCPTGTCPLQR